MSRVNAVGAPRVGLWLERYENALVLFLLFAVALAGIGRLEFFSDAISLSSWSVSRTTFIFWLLWKIGSVAAGRRWNTAFFYQPLPWALLVFFLTVAISLLPDFRGAGDFRYFLFGWLHALMLMDLFGTAARLRWLWSLLALMPAFIVVRGIIHDPSLLTFEPLLHLGLPLEERLGFPLDHPNTAGYLFSMSIPLSATLLLAEKGWLRAVSGASCAVQLLGLVLTYSRGGWLGCAAAMLLLAAISKHWKAMVCIVAVPVLLFVVLEPLRSRLLSVTDPFADRAMSDRIQVMRDGLELGYENPLNGIGYGRARLKEALREMQQGSAGENKPIWHTHNVFVEVFAGTGLAGLGAFLWLLARTGFDIAARANRAKAGDRMLMFGLAASWVAVAVSGLGDVPFYHHETRVYFFSLPALAYLSGKVPDLRASFKELRF